MVLWGEGHLSRGGVLRERFADRADGKLGGENRESQRPRLKREFDRKRIMKRGEGEGRSSSEGGTMGHPVERRERGAANFSEDQH